MKAMVLEAYGAVENGTLRLKDVPIPEPSEGQVLIRVVACGVCHTDIHVIEKELEPRRLPIIPGHQVTGVVERVGNGVERVRVGDKVGVTWINSTCGVCEFCTSGRENLCDDMHFTGYDHDGGFAEYVTASEKFTFKMPEGFDYIHAAPLFCAGIIGYRALKLSGVQKGQTLSIFGFGASGHIIAQIARHMGIRTVVFTRGIEHQKLAMELGAEWAGDASDKPPLMADASIITAPSGALVVDSLRNMKKGGRIAIEDIYMTPIPEIDYNKYLYNERWIGSVANYTRADAEEFLGIAAKTPISTRVSEFGLQDANSALKRVKEGSLNGAGVLRIGKE